jgi:hypothetical protein
MRVGHSNGYNQFIRARILSPAEKLLGGFELVHRH